MKQYHFLLINPPIYDFAAYDLWARPLGLLYIARVLMNTGSCVQMIDCLDRSSSTGSTQSNAYGCGHYPYEEQQKPDTLRSVPRIYKRYGMQMSEFEKTLDAASHPDAILVTSGMTYWYPGVFEVIQSMKERFPDIPVILGGTYASLCREHAVKFSRADSVVSGDRIADLFQALACYGIFLDPSAAPENFIAFPDPAYELYPKLTAAALRTTRGCPFRCTYCAVHSLTGEVWEKKTVDNVVAEIRGLAGRGVADIAFYDDALLVDAQEHIVPLLEEVIRSRISVRFHSPNGLHARCIDANLAGCMKRAGFTMPRISLETSDAGKQRVTGGKVSNEDFLSACGHLRESGYRPGEYGAYIMIGMPDQAPEEVEASMGLAHGAGAKVFLAEYSPIPGTAEWGTITGKLPSEDPLWHNNSLFPLFPLSDWPRFQKLKDRARELNKELC